MKQTDFKPNKPGNKGDGSISPAVWHKKVTKLAMSYKPTYIATDISITWYGSVDGLTIKKYFICFQWGDEVKIFDGMVWENVMSEAKEFLTTYKTIKND